MHGTSFTLGEVGDSKAEKCSWVENEEEKKMRGIGYPTALGVRVEIAIREGEKGELTEIGSPADATFPAISLLDMGFKQRTRICAQC